MSDIHPDRPHLGVSLVRWLVATQFPQWAGLPVKPVEPGGWDNRTFRLGDDMSVRLPSAERYVLQVEKEHRWLPVLAAFAAAHSDPAGDGTPGRGLPLALVGLPLDRR